MKAVLICWMQQSMDPLPLHHSVLLTTSDRQTVTAVTPSALEIVDFAWFQDDLPTTIPRWLEYSYKHQLYARMPSDVVVSSMRRYEAAMDPRLLEGH